MGVEPLRFATRSVAAPGRDLVTGCSRRGCADSRTGAFANSSPIACPASVRAPMAMLCREPPVIQPGAAIPPIRSYPAAPALRWSNSSQG